MNTRQKGRRLQIFVANELKRVLKHKYIFSRADSGAGKYHKEDITLPDFIPLHIEVKNQAKENLKDWWEQTISGCPKSKYPVLIYKLNYEKKPNVYMRVIDLVLLLESDIQLLDNLKAIINFDDFLEVLKNKYGNNKKSENK